MAAIEFPAQPTRDAIYAHYEANAEEDHRAHLGASLLGHECDRFLWLTFRWARREKFSGRMLRLFETGHMAEPRLAANLRAIGVELHTEDPAGRQWRISFAGGHAGGSMDGAGLGFPEGPKTWAVWECKTSGTKAFEAMKKDGVSKTKPMHFAQMQVYMGETGMHRACYTMVCKETDEIYSEWVHFDPVVHAKLIARAERIVASSTPPSRISDKPTWWQCKFCKFAPICHGEAAPEVNCRTCAHSTPDMNGTTTEAGGRWYCNVPSQPDGGGAGVVIPIAVQRTGCDQHQYIPAMLESFAKPVDMSPAGGVVYQTEAGQFTNGCGTAELSSVEIHNCEHKAFLVDLTNVKSMGFNQASIVKETSK